MTTPKTLLNHKMGGVSIISGTLASASGAFPTFAIHFIVSSLYEVYSYLSNLFKSSIFYTMLQFTTSYCMEGSNI